MIKHLLLFAALLTLSPAAFAAEVAIAIHGGAGTLGRGHMSEERAAQYRASLEAALKAGHTVLTSGGSSLDAVTLSVRMLEEDPLFNAGKGAVFNAKGGHELDAAIMDGSTLAAGSVAGLRHVRNPILLARAVMEHSPHVMLAGEGAEVFARSRGIELVDPSWFDTPERWRQLQELRASEKRSELRPAWANHGTVGAVALDREGRLAAATSTGGMTNKRWGRVGDAPLIGSGTYASNAMGCAVSATGWGEFFIRVNVAHDICARVAYRGQRILGAAKASLDAVKALGGDGGVIVIDRKGRIAMPYNTEGMYRASIDTRGRMTVAIFE